MLIIRNIIITILLLTLVAISVVGIMVEAPPVLNWTPDRINALGRSVLQVLRPGLLLFLVWWLILLGTLLAFFITVARPRKRMKIEVQMGGGKVVIMDAAIKKYIRNALSEMGEVHVKKIDLREHKNMVTSDIYADVRTKENLPIIERRIISRVRTALAEDLGITNLGDVHVYIRNFEVIGRPIKHGGAAATGAAVAGSDEPEPATAEKSTDGDGSPSRPQTLTETETHEDSEIEKTGAAAAMAASPASPDASDESNQEATPPPLINPVELPGATEPISIPESDDESPAATESTDSESTVLAEKSLPPQENDPDKTGGHNDVDEPLPWGMTNAVRPETADEESKKDSDKR